MPVLLRPNRMVAAEEENGSPTIGDAYFVVENPRPSDSILARRLSLSRSKVAPAGAVEPEAMERGDGSPEESPGEGAPRVPARVPALLQYDYMQAELCGPHPTGMRVKLRRAVPRHLRNLGVTNATWLHWMDELARVQQAEPYPASGTMALYTIQCCFLGDCGIGPQWVFNSMACCDGHSHWCRDYQSGMRQWLELLNADLPQPAYAKIISYRLYGTWAWVLEIATTDEAAAALRDKPIFRDCVPWANFRGGEHKDNCPPGARAMYGRYA